MKKKSPFLLSIALCIHTVALSQYIGGSGRGDITQYIYSINANDFILYAGGNGRGDVSLNIANINSTDFNIYHGGSGRGDVALLSNNINTNDLSLYHGGNGRGDAALLRTNVNTNDFSLFYGGNGRGDMALLKLDVNSDMFSFFHGGNGRGDMALLSTNVNRDDLNLYLGGSGRGDMALLKSDVNSEAFSLFHGGNGRGDLASLQFNMFVPICNFPDIPVLSVTDDTICNGQSTILAIATGNLYDATHWKWYSGTCGGTSIGIGDSISVVPTSATTYYVRGEGACVTNTSCASISIVTEACGSTLNLTLFLQGYYNSAGNMTPTLLNEGVSLNTGLTDSITIELHHAASPFGLVESKTVALLTNGSATCSLNTSGLFYIVVRHRNTVATWSALPITISTLNHYDFSNASAKAFGANQTEVDPGIFAFYSGDINQDENIDLDDFSLLELDINNFEFGYQVTDINGDGSVDLQDVPLLELNSNQFIFVNHP